MHAMTQPERLCKSSAVFAIFGTGGFGRELVRPARELLKERPGELVFVTDQPNGPVMGIRVISPDELGPDDQVVIAVGSSAARKAIAGRLAGRAGQLIARTALIGPDVAVGEGAVFCDFTMVTASARLGVHFHCNIYSYVAHDCVIGDYVTFAPKVCCNGNVHIGDGAYIGTGAVLRQGTPDKPLIIGKDAVVGMGAVVTKDVAPGATVVGNPARPLERKG
jgi:sugar O-acyltransferase (sialic acid O-acetyltransferase NeuD family)